MNDFWRGEETINKEVGTQFHTAALPNNNNKAHVKHWNA